MRIKLLALALCSMMACSHAKDAGGSNDTSQEMCLDLVSVMCERAIDCGFAPGLTVPQCLSTQAPGCVQTVGITKAEHDACLPALVAMPCDGSMPVECQGIAD